MHNSTLNIGLFGFGTVGEGLYKVLKHSKTVNANVKRICIKNKKERSISENIFTFNPGELINDPEINLIVELIDDDIAAYDIVKGALLQGKSVVTGNKKMLAYHLEELIQLQQENKCALLYDASACGSIPVIRNLEEYYDNDLLQSVTGILNGSSNYILSKLFNSTDDFAASLKQAQDNGFAESNPVSDITGLDSLYKLVILATHALGTVLNPDEIFHYGISKITPTDIHFAKEKNLKIKLIAQLVKLENGYFSAFVIPKLVDHNDYIYNVEDEYNGVVIEGEFYEKQFMFGKGAGAFPTGSAVLSDITARSHNYKYEYKKRKYFKPLEYSSEINIEIYLRYSNLVDFSHFDFEEIHEKFTSKGFNYVIGSIKLSKLIELKKLLPKLDIFIAYTGNLNRVKE